MKMIAEQIGIDYEREKQMFDPILEEMVNVYNYNNINININNINISINNNRNIIFNFNFNFNQGPSGGVAERV